MKLITIGFSKSAKKFPVGSLTIRAYQGTAYSHIYLRLDTPSLGSDTIVHASEGKVHRMSEYQFDKRHIVTDEFILYVSDEIYSAILLDLHHVSGADYGLMQNVGIFLVDMLNLIGIKIKNPFTSGWNCSEFIAYILDDVLKDQFKDIDKQTVTPKQIHKILKSLR